MREVCLVDAFRSLGLKVTYERDGPFYAIADDRRILSSIGLLDYIKTNSHDHMMTTSQPYHNCRRYTIDVVEDSQIREPGLYILLPDISLRCGF